MTKKFSKSVFFTLIAFVGLNVFMLSSCNDEAATTTETTTVETTTPAPPVESTAPPVESTAPPKDSLAVKANTPMDTTAVQKPTEQGKKK